MTFREAHAQAAGILTQCGIAEAAFDAMYLLEEVSGLNRTMYLCRRDEPMPEEEKNRFFDLIRIRSGRVPLQHIIGKTEFMGYEFKVTGDVLVPRADTEILVEEALAFLRKRTPDLDRTKADAEKIHVLDLCTGSGCIVISLCKLYHNGEYTGTDISCAALSVAEENARNLDADVTFLQGDLFEACSEEHKYHLIVSNPPYIVSDVIETLDPEVRDYDPMLALDGGADGLDFYRRIIASAQRYLFDGGALMFEIGSDQGKSVSALMEKAGFYEVRVIRDLAGLDRVVLGHL